VQKIDKFIGALDDVGIPTQHAIYVAVNGYTGGAVQRTRAAGVKTLVLTGLSQDRLRAHVAQASQNVIFLVPRTVRFTLVNNVGELEDDTQLDYLYDERGDFGGYLPDLLWTAWVEGRMPLAIGEHEVEIDIPDGCHHIVDGKKESPISASAKVEVSAAVISFAGRVEQHSLMHASDNTTAKYSAKAAFDTARSEYPVTNLRTESDLQEFLERRSGTLRVTVGRIKVPRMRVGPIFWPPSERVAREMKEIERRHLAGEVSDPKPLLADLYKGDLRMMFEPMWPDHPMLRKMRIDARESERKRDT
jgi:hypothetical protein